MDVTSLARPLSSPGAPTRVAPFVAVTALATLVLALDPASTDGLVPVSAGAALTWVGVLLLVPWRRLPAWTEAVAPAVGLACVLSVMRWTTNGVAVGYGGVAMLPIVWVALYGTRPQLLGTLVFVAVAYALPVLSLPDPTTRLEVRRALLWLSAAAVVGPIVHHLVRAVASTRAAELAQARVLSATLEAIAEPVVRYRAVRDADGQVVDFSREWLNHAAAELAGRNTVSLEETQLTQVGGDSREIVQLLASALTSPSPVRIQYWWPSAPTHRWMEGCAVGMGDDRVLCTWRDATSVRARLERLTHDALHDALTGLPNRRLLMDRLNTVLRGRDAQVAVLVIDLDRFKHVNDTHGHEAGDEVLVQVARRLEGALRVGDTVARVGGDEFVAVLPGIGPQASADLGAIVLRIAEAVQAPIRTRVGDVHVGASIGHALGRSGDEAEALISWADASMYDEKGTPGRLVLVRA